MNESSADRPDRIARAPFSQDALERYEIHPHAKASAVTAMLEQIEKSQLAGEIIPPDTPYVIWLKEQYEELGHHPESLQEFARRLQGKQSHGQALQELSEYTLELMRVIQTHKKYEITRRTAAAYASLGGVSNLLAEGALLPAQSFANSEYEIILESLQSAQQMYSDSMVPIKNIPKPDTFQGALPVAIYQAYQMIKTFSMAVASAADLNAAEQIHHKVLHEYTKYNKSIEYNPAAYRGYIEFNAMLQEDLESINVGAYERSLDLGIQLPPNYATGFPLALIAQRRLQRDNIPLDEHWNILQALSGQLGAIGTSRKNTAFPQNWPLAFHPDTPFDDFVDYLTIGRDGAGGYLASLDFPPEASQFSQKASFCPAQWLTQIPKNGTLQAQIETYVDSVETAVDTRPQIIYYQNDDVYIDFGGLMMSQIFDALRQAVYS